MDSGKDCRDGCRAGQCEACKQVGPAHRPTLAIYDDALACGGCGVPLLTGEAFVREVLARGYRKIAATDCIVTRTSKDAIEKRAADLEKMATDLRAELDTARQNANILADTCGALDAQVTRLLADNTRYRLRAESAERKAKR